MLERAAVPAPVAGAGAVLPVGLGCELLSGAQPVPGGHVYSGLGSELGRGAVEPAVWAKTGLPARNRTAAAPRKNSRMAFSVGLVIAEITCR